MKLVETFILFISTVSDVLPLPLCMMLHIHVVQKESERINYMNKFV